MTLTSAMRPQTTKQRKRELRRGVFSELLEIIAFTIAITWIALNLGRLFYSLQGGRDMTAFGGVRDALTSLSQDSGPQSVDMSMGIDDGVGLLYDCESFKAETELVVTNLDGEEETLDSDILDALKQDEQICSSSESSQVVVFIRGVFNEENDFVYFVDKYNTEHGLSVTSSVALGSGTKTINLRKEGGVGQQKSILVEEVTDDQGS